MHDCRKDTIGRVEEDDIVRSMRGNAMEKILNEISVRLGWTSKMYGGKFAGREVESLKMNEWIEITKHLQSGICSGPYD